MDLSDPVWIIVLVVLVVLAVFGLIALLRGRWGGPHRW